MKPNRYAKEIAWLLKEKYKGKLTPRAELDIARIHKGEPVDYVIGWAPFLDTHIDLSRKPHIPRPETEFWTEHAIEAMRVGEKPRKSASWRTRNKPLRVLDVFAGSGCIGIAILKHLPNARVDFGELSTRLHSQVLKNVRMNHIRKNRTRFIHSNVFSKIKGSYDFILANPPYVPGAKRKSVTQSVLNYEPHSAIFGGRDGLFYIRKLLKEAPAHLTPGGELWMEFDTRTKKKIEKLVKKYLYKTSFHKDQYGKWRYLRTIVG